MSSWFEEMFLDLHTFDPEDPQLLLNLGELPSSVTFGFIGGGSPELLQAVWEVDVEWPQYFTDPQSKVFCGFSQGEIVSFCLVSPAYEQCLLKDLIGDSKRIGMPGCVGTRPSYRKQGIGLYMVYLVTKYLKEEGYDYSYIHYTGVSPFYNKLGYRTFLKWNPEEKSLDTLTKQIRTMQEMKEIDRSAIEDLGISSLLLMEHAAKEVLNTVLEQPCSKVTILCGAGNNGGDGVCLAGLLAGLKIESKVYFCGSREKMTEDEQHMEVLLKNQGGSLLPLCPTGHVLDDFIEDLKTADCVVDALFGVGINRELSGIFKTAVDLVNIYGRRVISCDIPSGLQGDTGEVLGTCIHADETVTFSCLKKGMLRGEGLYETGITRVASIGIPEDLLDFPVKRIDNCVMQ